MMVRATALLCLVAILAGCATSGDRRGSAVMPATEVDLPRFMGTWHVIAHVPYFFENGKVATRDEYRLRPDGRIDNDFVFKRRFGEPDRRWRGVSEVVPGSGGARWRVQFVWPFSTELVVVHVDPDYQSAALATPDGKLAWIFGRSAVMAPERRAALVARLRAAGADVAGLADVPQVAHARPGG